MDREHFINTIKKVVRDTAIEDLRISLEAPPGRNISKVEQSRSDWYNSLSLDDRMNLESVIREAIDESIFGLLCVIDGVRAIENSEEKGRLILAYKKNEEIIELNNLNDIDLHDLYADE